MDIETYSINKVLASIIIDTALASIDTQGAAVPSGALSFKHAAKKAVLQHIKQEITKDGAIDGVMRAIKSAIDERVVVSRESLESQRRIAEEAAAKSEKAAAAFNEARENFLRSDPVSQRLIAMKDMIEETIPLDSLSNTHETQQAMRSRGLAIAAMCGLTHYGYPGPAKEAK